LEKRLKERRERKKESISSNSRTSFTPSNPLHGELKINCPYLLDSSPKGLIHSFDARLKISCWWWFHHV